MDRNKESIYEEKLEIGVYYIYDKHKKIYDTESMREEFNQLIKKLEN
tara:strand:+ start:755 stop:895 length:141 start_codon:yes stop_codon:yes gene_type:complete